METAKRAGLRSSPRNEMKKMGSKDEKKHQTAKPLKGGKRQSKKVVVEAVLPLEMSSDVIEQASYREEQGQSREGSDRDQSVIDEHRFEQSGEMSRAEMPKEIKGVSREMSTQNEQQKKDQARQEKDDVLSVVIQKLTELVKSSESLCSPANKKAHGSGCSSGANTPPKAIESKKKPRKRRHKSQLYKCPHCPCLFAIRKRDLKKEREILCSCCEKLKQAKAEALKEKLEQTVTPLQVVPLESWKVVCDVCSQWVSDYTSLLYHLASHTDVQIFKCKLCDFVTTKQGKIESHQASHRPREISNKFVCSLCKFSTNEFARMEEHLKSHDQKKLLVLKCSVCGYTCRSEEVLRYHMVTHIIEPTGMKVARKCGDVCKTGEEDDDVFKCTVCGYSCDKLSTLKSHSWRHAGEQSCSYPVEESDDEASIDVNEKLKELSTGSMRNSPDSSDPDGSEDEKTMDSSKDLSRLAIGCCGTKGQACCSENAGQCQCKSIDVPASQQPVLKVILNDIVNKTAEAVSDDGKIVAPVGTDGCRNDESMGGGETAQVADESNKNLSVDDIKKTPKEDGNDKVEHVLDECSTLIDDFYDKMDRDGATTQVDNIVCGGKKRSVDGQNCCKSAEKSSCPSSREKEVEKTTEIPQTKDMSMPSDDGSIIVVVENVGFTSLLEDTASVVEVTTSEEPHPSSAPSPSLVKEDVKIAIKRLLTPPQSGGEPSAKKLTKEDSAGISKLLLNVVEDLVEKPTTPQVKSSSSEIVEKDRGWSAGGQIICPFCDEQVSCFISLKRHLLDHCRDEILHSCLSCPAKFTSKTQLITHQRVHSTEPAAAAAATAVANSNKAQVEQERIHIQQMQVAEEAVQTCTEGIGTSTNRKCTLCGRKFRTKASLYLHEQECTTKKKEFPCIECDFVGNTRKELNEHLTESHKKPFKCALCQYTSATPSGIKNHMKFHAVDKPYKCHLCNFSGAYPQSLRSHLKVHANSEMVTQTSCEQYKCKLCGYISCHLPSMKSHMWRHARDPGFDYNMVDDIIKDASPTSGHVNAPTGHVNANWW
ncbi:putative zinc finger protein [Apostichopus japonicus]|uniref:Putative zinc finger protein n=1 Tax=Stichopus japonicus TaxID=307972 RepID=A0A2G8LB20_STIJA|nr:putative zinc finger protein [Apostichopus japonicus]